MSRRAHVTTKLLNHLRTSLTTNEWGVLEDLAVMRLATATDLQALQDLRQPISVRQFRRLLARLDQQGVLFRLERSVGGRARGSASFVYALGSAGHRLRTLDGQPTPRPWTPRPSWLRHALSASRLYVILRELEGQQRLQLYEFATEPGSWRTFADGDGEVTLKPDAFAVLDHDEFRDSYFIEVDCATESPATLAKKCAVYSRYWQSGVEQNQSGVFPQVLWLVPSDGRLGVVRRVIAAQGDAAALHTAARYDHAEVVFDDRPP